MSSDSPQPSPKRPWWKPSSWFSVFRRNKPVPDPPPPRSNAPLQQPVWVPDPVWDMPPRSRNLALEALSQEPAFVHVPPGDPQAGTAIGSVSATVSPPAEMTLTETAGVTTSTDAQTEAIETSFQEALRRAADVTSLIDQLRKASTGREIGPGHNRGPSLDDLDEVEELIALLKEDGPKVKTKIDAKALIEQTEKVKTLPERIWSLLKAAGLMVGTIGLHEVTKDLTAPIWDEVVHKIIDLCEAIEVWVSLLPPM
jgi:hypothetical protein